VNSHLPIRSDAGVSVRRVHWGLLAMCGFAVALTSFGTVFHPTPLLIYNASASARIGFYRVLPAPRLRRGDLVLARMPDAVRPLAAERGYIPAAVPLVKRVSALAGDMICGLGRDVSIDGHLAARRLPVDPHGRPLPAWSGCRRLESEEVFLLMPDVPDSFDGRYFGAVQRDAVIGRLVPLWGC
jgi:conjugative transfer signal peptidase TraF